MNLRVWFFSVFLSINLFTVSACVSGDSNNKNYRSKINRAWEIPLVPLEIRTIPAGASILIDGKQVGDTSNGNLLLDIPLGVHKITTRLEGYKDYEVSQYMGGDGTREIFNLEIEVSNSEPLETAPEGMVFIKGGCFQMGDTFEFGYEDEIPVHKVCVDSYYLGEHEVTQREWKELMGHNKSFFKECGDDCPVENVSWNDVNKYTEKLRNKTGKNYRLPTEGEWEFAARERGKIFKWAGTNDKVDLENYAWCYENASMKSHPVKTKRPNGLGIYDMSGNVFEWISDWYDDSYFLNSPINNPKGSDSGHSRVVRGGSFSSKFYTVRTARRFSVRENNAGFDLGFRLAMTP